MTKKKILKIAKEAINDFLSTYEPDWDSFNACSEKKTIEHSLENDDFLYIHFNLIGHRTHFNATYNNPASDIILFEYGITNVFHYDEDDDKNTFTFPYLEAYGKLQITK